MRQKVPRNKLPDGVILDIVRGYHLRGERQADLASKHGVPPSHVSQICHGDLHRWAYDQVAREEAATAEQSQ